METENKASPDNDLQKHPFRQDKLEGQVLYFLHIPKTAGTTFTSILDRQFPPKDVCPAKLWHELVAISPDELARYRVFRGHFQSGLAAFLNRDLTCLTFLRDPIERTISLFEYLRRERGHYMHDIVAGMTLRQFVTDVATRGIVENAQTRSIAQDLNVGAILASMRPSDRFSPELERYIETLMPHVPDDILLARAIERIDRYEFVGLVERFHYSLGLACRRFGWVEMANYPVLNASTNRIGEDEITPGALRAIKDATQLDAELYSHAQKSLGRLAERI